MTYNKYAFVNATVSQFGLDESTAPGITSLTIDPYLRYIEIGVWVVGMILLVICFFYVIRFILRQRTSTRNATFHSTTLLITLPKYKRESESERSETKEAIIETIATAEAFFASIGGLKAERGLKAWFYERSDEFAFELVMNGKEIKFYVTVPNKYRVHLEQQLSSSYPDANIEEVEDFNLFQPTSVILGSYLKLKRESAFPIKTFRKLDRDPLNALTNTLAKIPDGEAAAFQFIVRSSKGKWRDRGIGIASRMQQGMSMNDAISGRKSKKFSVGELTGFGTKNSEPEKDYRLSPQEEEVVKGLQEKASKSGMDVCIRLVVSGKTSTSAAAHLQNMLSAFSQYNIYEYGNSFVKGLPRLRERFLANFVHRAFDETHLTSRFKKQLIRRFIHRVFDEKYTIVLNAEEMASLWHLPTQWTETPNIKWLGARRGPAPSNVPHGPNEGDIELGYNTYRGVKTPVWMKKEDRSRHMYLIGKSGSGKSQTIAKYAVQDIQAGHGVAVVDPHGDLIELILGHIPKERIDDVIVFNPSDMERPMGLNMLEAKDPSMKDFAVQEMISIFYKLFPPEMIGPMFEHHMRNAMLTLMSDPDQPGSLIEIPRMFSDADFQKKWRAKVTDPVVMSYWVNEIDKTSDFHKSETLGYLISKVGRFVENEMMRNIIGQQRSSFDFREVMDKKKILLVNLSKGKTGDVNAELLGLIIVSKLQMAALGRADMPEKDRHDFYLYIDEFQNFITDSIATILSEARKYRLNLIIAHQYIGQLVKNNKTEIKDAVFGNVGTMFTARIGPEDVEILEKVYAPEFSGYDLINSDKFTWYVKMVVDMNQLKPFTMNINVVGKGNKELGDAIKELSRLKFGRDKKIVESEILERTQLVQMDRMQPPASGLTLK